jgi:hypothetical protein
MHPAFAILLVFTGCCSNVVFLELLIRLVKPFKRSDLSYQNIHFFLSKYKLVYLNIDRKSRLSSTNFLSKFFR